MIVRQKGFTILYIHSSFSIDVKIFLYILPSLCDSVFLFSKNKCRLLVTHDDYSMMSKLPRERASVVSILRQPIDRIFSTYEFSIEVAARFLIHPNLTSATRMAGRLRAKTRGVSTLDIWPWKYLVPWMREDLFARVCFLYNIYNLEVYALLLFFLPRAIRYFFLSVYEL